jgi:hypothetical protein
MKTVRLAVVGVLAAAVLGTTATPALASTTAALPANNSAHGVGRHFPAVAVDWAAAWNSGDPQRLADLFVADGARYTDHAFDVTSTGRAGVAAWLTETDQKIDKPAITINGAFTFGNQTVISWTFSGQVWGAPTPFSVPVVTFLGLRGHQIVIDDDYYSKAEVLRQSGLSN